MSTIIYIVGLVVVIGAVLSFFEDRLRTAVACT